MIPRSLIEWAQHVARTHPSARDAHVVIPGLVSGGDVKHPDVTLGELRRFVDGAKSFLVTTLAVDLKAVVEERDQLVADLLEARGALEVEREVTRALRAQLDERGAA